MIPSGELVDWGLGDAAGDACIIGDGGDIPCPPVPPPPPPPIADIGADVVGDVESGVDALDPAPVEKGDVETSVVDAPEAVDIVEVGCVDANSDESDGN